jgi:hypothetical protein
MAEEYQSRVPRIVHASLAVATVGLAFFLGLVALGILYDVEDASLVVRSIGFAALVAWTATTLGFAYRAWRATFSGEPPRPTAGEKDKRTGAKDSDREESPLRDRVAWIATVSALGVAVLLTLAVIGAILFEGKGNPDAALAVVGISPAGQVAVAQQCGGATLPQLTAEIDESSLDEQELRLRPVGACRGADEVVIPQQEVAGITLLDDALRADPEIGRIAIDWSVPARLRAGDPEGRGVLPPSRWPVVLEVSDSQNPSCEGAAYRWSISRSDSSGALRLVPSRVSQDQGCAFSVSLPVEDAYRVDLVVTSVDGSVATGSAEIIVQDWLIVALGDSVASGEGHPARRPPHWRGSEQGCHRSANAWPRRAALMLEEADERTSVTLVHLACTGARIRRTGEYIPGQVLLAEESATVLPTAQFGQAGQFFRRAPREIDAVVLSVGANDIAFSEIVITCLRRQNCNERYDTELPRRLTALEESYDALGDAFRSSSALRDAPVYLTEYFDPLHDENGNACRIGVPLFKRAQITPEEAEWAFLEVLQPLLAAGRNAAETHGWTYVDGIVEKFAAHGYCARDSWIVRIAGAASRAPGFFGVLNLRRVFRSMRQFPFHPENDGHRAYAELVAKTLRNDFYDSGGEPRRPRLAATAP